MPTDFDGTVLKAAMGAFALPVNIVPNDGSAAYAAQGVWRYQDIDVLMEDGSTLSSTTITLGIRLSDWPAIPKVGYAITATPPAWAPVTARAYLIDKVRPDGQGGANLILKAQQPVVSTG
jgi:hypothetical protein